MVSIEVIASKEASWTTPGAGITSGYNEKEFVTHVHYMRTV